MENNISNQPDERILATLRNIAPVKIEYWSRKERITMAEGLFLYYRIDPEGPHGIRDYELELKFQKLDRDGIYDLMKDSFKSGSLSLRLGSMLVRDFCLWLLKKKFEVPECLRSHLEDTSPKPKESMTLNTVPEVLQIDFGTLSPAVIAALGMNVIAELCIRKTAKESKSTPKLSTVLGTHMAKELKAMCAASEGTEEKADSTCRKYIEHRFK